jgi:membrane-associated phospholipid phosphatase
MIPEVACMPVRRAFWLFIILIFLALYFPINRFAHGGMQLSLPIDSMIPLYPPAIVPYLFGSVLFVAFPIWAAFKARKGQFEAFTLSILLGTAISYLVYVVFPTYVVRPEIGSTDIFSKAIDLLYQTDKAYNAAPSGHALYTTLIFLYLARWKPGSRYVWLVVASLILASTLLTRQHNVLDMVSGLTLGVVAFWIGRLVQTRWNLSFASYQ